MAAPKGNEYWKSREKHGRERKYTPEALWDIVVQYFEWADANPWYRNEAVKSGDNAGMIIKIPTQRPYTISGLCAYAGISVNTFDVYSKTKDYNEVATRTREIIYTQKFEGAAVGAFNPNIIARDLGLTDKKDVTSAGKAIGDVKHEIVFKDYARNVNKP